MNNKILIANLNDALWELSLINDKDTTDLSLIVDTIQHLIEKTIKDLEKEPYVKSYQLMAVWNDGMIEQFSNIPIEFGKMFSESLKTLKKVSK